PYFCDDGLRHGTSAPDVKIVPAQARPSELFAYTGLIRSLCELQLGPGDAAIGLQIALAGGVDDACRQRRRRGFAVPAAGVAFDVEIIAQRLLVEARLWLAGRIG